MKTLQELTLLDKFLFDEAMDDTETYQALLRIILGDDNFKLLSPSQTEKEFRTAPWLRSIRVDVFSMDVTGTIYNTEMQRKKLKDLIKRTRYYQALIDSVLLSPGEADFNNLKDATVIMITPFDLFHKDRYIYTFEEVCQEDPSIKLNDGSKRIFINTRGTNTQDVSPEFIALMKFIEYNETEGTNGTIVDSSNKNLAIIKNRVAAIKASEEVGVKYMNKWEEEAIIRQEAKTEGIQEGIKEGIETERLSSIRKVMQSFKVTAEQAMESLDIPANDFEKYKAML